MTIRFPALACLLLPLFLAGCGADQPAGSVAQGPAPAGPLPAGTSASRIAAETGIEKVEPQDWPDLHNVFVLSKDIVSGSEPHGEEALKRIAETWGVKTILSVDGKAPDVELAKTYGMRYVHVPIEYSGIDAAEMIRIAKVFRELEGPFYVHCFHGKHRGPAAAAVGRIVLDGAPRARALAEMRQWCGTSTKYDGLYEVIGRGSIPASEDTASFDWDFPAAHTFQGFRQVMIDVSRVDDHLKSLMARDWTVDPAHPDLNAAHEASRLAELFAAAAAFDEVQGKPDDFRAWLQTSVEQSRALADALRGEPVRVDAGREAYEAVAAACNDCHAAYRNTK